MPQNALMWSRRKHLISLGAAFSVVMRLDCHARSAPAETLKGVANHRGIWIGSNSDTPIRKAPTAYADTFLRECNLFAPNFGWSLTEPRHGVRILEPDRNTEFANAHGLELSGGHLLWHRLTPSWVAELASRKDTEHAIINYISAMVSHYKGQVFSWNVVNEAIEPLDGRSDGLRRNSVLQMLGPDYVDLAFRVARAADSSVLLALNDFHLEMDTRDHERRRRAFLKLVDHLQHVGSPIDAIGLQSHLDARDFRFNEREYRGFLREISSRGLKIVISELDVLDIGLPATIRLRDEGVAEVYRRFLSVALDERAVVAVVTWGLSDRYSWINVGRSSNPYLQRPDRLPGRPLPFDDSFRPKPAFRALLQSLNRAPLRTSWRHSNAQPPR